MLHVLFALMMTCNFLLPVTQMETPLLGTKAATCCRLSWLLKHPLAISQNQPHACVRRACLQQMFSNHIARLMDRVLMDQFWTSKELIVEMTVACALPGQAPAPILSADGGGWTCCSVWTLLQPLDALLPSCWSWPLWRLLTSHPAHWFCLSCSCLQSCG